MRKGFEFSKLNAFLMGVGIGAIVALVFAPKSGEELREDISTAVQHSVDLANKSIKQAKSSATHLYVDSFNKTAKMLKVSKTLLDKQKDIVSTAFEAGRKAYLDSKANHNASNATNIDTIINAVTNSET